MARVERDADDLVCAIKPFPIRVALFNGRVYVVRVFAILPVYHVILLMR